MSKNNLLKNPDFCKQCLFHEFDSKSGHTCEIYNKNLTNENVTKKIPNDCEEGVRI